MALGFVLGRGCWDIRQFNTNSAATFLKGSLVELNGARDVIEYASASSSVLGVAMQDSANSTPPGKVNVGIPTPGCTAYADVAPGMVASAISVGEALGVGKRGNYMSFVTSHSASIFSRIVTIVGALDSTTSRVEVTFNQSFVEVFSNSSQSLA